MLAKHLADNSHVGQLPFMKKETKDRKKRSFPCFFPGCEKSFADSSNRKKHLKIHDVNRERFICSELECRRSYSTKADLNIHMKVHRNVYHYSCSCCKKQFVRSSELYAHERHHDKMPPHLCSCGRRFREKSRLARHRKTHRNIEEKKFACQDK